MTIIHRRSNRNVRLLLATRHRLYNEGQVEIRRSQKDNRVTRRRRRFPLSDVRRLLPNVFYHRRKTRSAGRNVRFVGASIYLSASVIFQRTRTAVGAYYSFISDFNVSSFRSLFSGRLYPLQSFLCVLFRRNPICDTRRWSEGLVFC